MVAVEIPVDRELATKWFGVDPKAECYCVKCTKLFPVAGIGIPSVTCPRCGFTPPAEACRSCIKALDERMAREAAEAVQVVEETKAPRADPPGLADVIGNTGAVAQIRVALDAYRARRATSPHGVFPHTLLAGVGGSGKTMLAEIIAREIGRPIRLEMGQSLTSPARAAEVLKSLKAGEVLFVDEIHGMRSTVQETFYRAMEDGILVPIEKAGKPVGAPIKLPPFTLIGSTTDEWNLLPSMLQRFKYRVRLERMSALDLGKAIADRAKRKGWTVSDEAALMIAERAHGTPRLAVGLLDGCMDMAVAGGEVAVDRMIVEATCETWGIDAMGLDKTARRYLAILAEAGIDAVRLNVLATKLDGLSRRTVETRVEPDLVWLGLISKDADGRRLTPAGREHMKNGGLK